MVEAPSPELRAYRDTDRDGFAALVAEVLGEFGVRFDPLLEADLADPTAHYDAIWVVADAGCVVGSAAVRLLTGGSSAELKRMYLRASHRGRGLGRALLASAIDWARQHECRSVELDTTAAMAAARRLYESAGFRRSGERTEHGQLDLRCEILYTLALASAR